MSKVKITDSVHALDEIVKELFERIKHIHGEVGTALQGVKRRESQLIEKENRNARLNRSVNAGSCSLKISNRTLR